MKYVIVRIKDLELPIIFPDVISHSNFGYGDDAIVSAGFCAIQSDGSVEVRGKSIGLNKIARLKDVKLIERALKWEG